MLTEIKKQFTKIMALVFIYAFLFYSFAFANVPYKDFNIPVQFGTIKESFLTAGAEQNAGRTIIHIQDAHCNYEAQKNMAQVLEYLVKEHNLKLIMVEGGSGDVSLSFLRNYADEKARVEVADKYLKEGKISGEEYLDIVSDYPIELYGIEDEALYDAHLAAFNKVDAMKEEGLADLEDLSRIIQNLKRFVYSEELRQLEQKNSDYENKTISLAEYCRYLKEMSQKKGLNLQSYPHLLAFVETARLEKEIDFKQAEIERNAFIKDLANLLDENSVKELIEKSQDFKAKKLTPQEYYAFLKTAGEKKLEITNNYPQLAAYITYIKVSRDINAAELLKETEAASGKIKEGSLANAEQKRLSEIDKSLQVLTRILNLELTPQDYGYFKANQGNFLTASWIDFLTENCNKNNLAMPVSPASIIDENLKELESFYELGVAREQAFMKNLAAKMDESGQKLGVLITGGFHTPGVTQMLKEKGYSYIVVTPVITQKSDPNIYFSVLRGEKKPLPEAIREGE